MKKVLIALFTFIAVLSFGISAFAAEKKLTDFEGLSDYKGHYVVLPEGAATVGIYETNPISGKKSLSFTFDSSEETHAGNSGNIFLTPFGSVTDWSGYDYVAMKVRNLNKGNYVMMSVLADQTAKDLQGAERVARCVPSGSEAVIMRDSKNGDVEVDFIQGVMVLPEGFDGTVYLPLYAEDMEFLYVHGSDYDIDPDSCTYKSFYELVLMFMSPDNSFSGTILLDDIKLLKQSDIPQAAVETTPPAAPSTSAPVSATPVITTQTPTETVFTPTAVHTANTAVTDTPASASAIKAPASNTGLIVGIIAAVLVIGGAALYYFIIRKKRSAG